MFRRAAKAQCFTRPGDACALITIDSRDNLIVGTEPGGLIFRVSPTGEGFVLYQAPKREITAVAVARDGSIYAAGVGNKSESSGGGQGPGGQRRAGERMTAPAGAQPTPLSPGGQISTRAAPVSEAASAPPPLAAIAGGSELYCINPDGAPRRVWSHPQQVVYSIGFDAERRPLIGTGNKGVIYRLDSNLVYTKLLDAPPTQVTALYTGPRGRSTQPRATSERFTKSGRDSRRRARSIVMCWMQACSPTGGAFRFGAQ